MHENNPTYGTDVRYAYLNVYLYDMYKIFAEKSLVYVHNLTFSNVVALLKVPKQTNRIQNSIT